MQSDVLARENGPRVFEVFLEPTLPLFGQGIPQV